MHASPLATRHATQTDAPLRVALARCLQRLSLGLDAWAQRLQTAPAVEAQATPHLEFRHDPATGHGVLYEDGLRRFTFLQGLERL
ncbi:MAG: hypothetical protein ACK5W4_14595 [Inhella sp.]|jgi:hypothetical protein|uniref:hypothetical protein n=1 Tax=Inhella sp. TaxID=1921806 RepID=UPI00391F863E